MNRGLTVVHSLQLLTEGRSLARNEVFNAHVLGWCIEWVCDMCSVAGPACVRACVRAWREVYCVCRGMRRVLLSSAGDNRNKQHTDIHAVTSLLLGSR